MSTQGASPSAAAKTPLSQKLFWSVGGFGENLANGSLLSLAYPIFNIALGFSAISIGFALSISRILDAIVDPIVGNMTDNTHTRWGRRRPWIFVGAILMALVFAAIWILPAWLPPLPAAGTAAGIHNSFLHSLGVDSAPALLMLVILSVLCLLFYWSFTAFQIPYSGLGMEIVEDYADRTTIQTYRVLASFVASLLMGYLYLSSLKVGKWMGGNEVNGVRVVGSIAAVTILISCIMPAIFCKERYANLSSKKEKIHLLHALKLTITNKSFLMLMGSVFPVYIGLFFAIPLMTYIGIYHCCGGNKIFAAEIGGVMTIVQVVGQFLTQPLIAWANKYVDKKAILFTGLGVSIAGYSATWWMFTPAHPWLQILPYCVAAWGLCSCWAVNGSFSADICDDDELRTGHRREGLYSAVFSFVYKSAIGLVAMGSASLLAWVGIRGGGEIPTVEALTHIRFAYAVIPSVCLLFAILSMWKYPLTRKRVEEIQAELRIRREAEGAQ